MNFSDLQMPEFTPGAKFIPALDCLIYLREDCSYRAVRLDPLRTVLLHPTEDRPVGIKLKGMRLLYERCRAILESLHLNVDHVSLWTLWETACTSDGDELTARADDDRRKMYSARVREMIKDSGKVARSELPAAAA